MNYNGIIIGGGPAGMFAAITAAQNGQKVLLVEKNDRLGKKLLITGKGRCNVTNHCSVEEVLAATARNSLFLYGALSRTTPADVERFFTENEVNYLNSFGNEEKIEEFFRLWTMKESYMKMTGEGMRLSLDRFEFVFEDSIKLYRDRHLCSCHIKEYKIPGYKLTICAKESEFSEKIDYIDLR